MWNFLQNRQQNQPSITSNVTEFFNIGVSKTGVLPLSPLSLKVQVIKSQLTLQLTPFLLTKATAGLRSRETLPLLIQPSHGIRCVVWSNPQMPGHSGKPRRKMYSGIFHLFAHGSQGAPSFPLPFLPPWWAGQSWIQFPLCDQLRHSAPWVLTRKGSDYGQH